MNLIDAYIEAYESLVKLSKEMYMCLINRDLKMLLQITNSQSEIIGKLFMLGDREEVKNLRGKDLESLISDLPLEEQSEVRKKFEYLERLILELGELVRINSRLLGRSIELLDKYVEFLRKNVSLNSIFLEDRG
ncbi:MAG: flagellar export chaperone FlgN [bacterium]